MNGNGITAPAPTPEAELARARQLINLFRQQRDAATTMCNDLQVELALLRQAMAELQPEVSAPSDEDTQETRDPA